MGFFNKGETVRIDFPDGEWVDVKEELNQADQDYIMNSMAAVKEAAVSFNLGRLALLERSVVAWSQPESINRDNLSNMKRQYREPVLTKIDELNAKPYEYVTKN